MHPSRRTLLCLLLIVGCVSVAFGRVIGHAFVYWDDHLTLFQNPDFNPVTLAGVGKYWAAEKWDLYIPVTYTVWGALARVAQTPTGLNPAVFHAANVLLHTISGCLAFGILRLLTKSDKAACFGALLFALHPVQVEPVAWASGMKDVLCGALSLLAIWQYLLFAQSQRRVRFAIATVAYALAVLAKPSAVTVPIIAGLLDYFLVRHDAKKLLPLGLWLVMAVPIFLVTREAQSAAGVYASPLWMRPVIAWDAIGWYLKHVLMPVHLSLDYGRAPQRVWPPSVGWIWWWVVVALLFLEVWWARRWHPWQIAALGVLVAAVLPVLGFVRFAFQQYSTVADHYLYVAMLGPAIAFAFVLNGRGRRAFALAAFVLVALGVRSVTQAAHWRDTRTLFAHVQSVNPDSFAAHGVLGFLAREAGDNESAVAHYQRALETYPSHGITNYNLANAMAVRGDHAGALPHYARAVASEPQNAHYRRAYASALARLQRWADALEQLEILLRLTPDDPEVLRKLAIARERARPTTQSAP